MTDKPWVEEAMTRREPCRMLAVIEICRECSVGMMVGRIQITILVTFAVGLSYNLINELQMLTIRA